MLALFHIPTSWRFMEASEWLELMEAQAVQLGNKTGSVGGRVGKPAELDSGIAQLEPSPLGIADSVAAGKDFLP